MIIAALLLGGLGLAAALGLGIAARVFYVEVDPVVEKIEEALPGANCGGCGYAGCTAAAVAISQGKMEPTGCVASSPEAHAEIAAIMGVSVSATEPMVARVGCRYPLEKADRKFEYQGASDCRAAFLVAGGPKECSVGCLGLGTCVQACPFDALSIGAEGLPIVDEVACTGCGTCARVCPAGIMRLTSMTDRILQEYQPTDCTAPCQRRCPAGIDVPEQIHLTNLGEYEGALRVIMERNPLPLICGRICPAHCEESCRRNQADEPVAINNLKRFVSDYLRTRGRRPRHYVAPSTGRSVGVVGGGVEGMTAAFFLARLGHEATIYEAMPKLGGLLRTAIPESRLPEDVLDWEIDNILDLGVKARTGKVFGDHVKVSGLLDEHEALLLALGGWDAMLMQGDEPTPALPGLSLLLPATLRWAMGLSVEVGERVVLVGGGKDASFAADRCLEDGAKQVVVLHHQSRSDLDLTEQDVEGAASRGVALRFGVTATRLVGQEDRVVGLSIIDGGGEEEQVDGDTIFAAAGRLPDLVITRIDDSDGQWQAARPYRPDDARVDLGLFAEVDPVSDYRAAVQAIGAGRRAAASVHRVLRGDPLAPERWAGPGAAPQNEVPELHNLIIAGPRVRQPLASADDRQDPRCEIAHGLTEETALAESDRCLRCGLICYLRTSYDRAEVA